MASSRSAPHPGPAHHGGTAALVVGATGVVFGDIGTSPLYAMKESLAVGGLTRDADTILGIASLIFWALTLVVTIKYLTFIMRADNHGEGGILALLALLPDFLRRSASGKATVPAVLILVGAGLLYGDGALTPAISVLSAVEGIGVLNPSLETAAVPITCVILLGLFLVQSRGTALLGRVFGPVMICWFLLIGGLGLVEVLKEPSVFKALLPTYAFQTLTGNGIHGFLLLGSIILAVTGAEALYADMGHFGSRPIRMAWLALVKPALVLAYLGQAAMVINNPEAAESPLYSLAPNRTWALVMLGLATTRHDHRLAGADHRGVLVDEAGGPARVLPAGPDQPYVRSGRGADLHPGDQLDADGGLYRPGPAVPDLGEPGIRIRRRGLRNDGDHLGRVLRRGHSCVGLDPAAGRHPGWGVPPGRPVLPCRDAPQVHAGRLRPRGHRPGRGGRDVRLALRVEPAPQPRGREPADLG